MIQYKLKFIHLLMLLAIGSTVSFLLFAIHPIAIPLSKAIINNQQSIAFTTSSLPKVTIFGNESNVNNIITKKQDDNSSSSNLSKSYVNSTYGIKMDYPPGWIIKEGDAATIFHNQSKSLNVVAEIMTPIQSSYYNLKIGASHNSIRLVVEDYNTFGDYANDNIQKYINNKDSVKDNRDKLLAVANKRIGAIGLYCHNFDLKSWNQNASLAGFPAHQIFLDYSYDKYSKDATEIWSIKDNKIYIIEFVAQDQYYDQYLPLVNKMVKSFQIL